MASVHAQGLQGQDGEEDEKGQSGEIFKSRGQYHTYQEIINPQLGGLRGERFQPSHEGKS